MSLFSIVAVITTCLSFDTKTLYTLTGVSGTQWLSWQTQFNTSWSWQVFHKALEKSYTSGPSRGLLFHLLLTILIWRGGKKMQVSENVLLFNKRAFLFFTSGTLQHNTAPVFAESFPSQVAHSISLVLLSILTESRTESKDLKTFVLSVLIYFRSKVLAKISTQRDSSAPSRVCKAVNKVKGWL